MQFRISSRRENRYRYTQVIKIRILIKIFSKQFCVIRCRRQTALDRWIGEGGIPLLRTLLVISQNSREPSFWEVMELFCFSSICKFGSLNKPFATITSLAEPYFRFRGFILLVQTKKKNDFYELWQQHKQQKTMHISETWLHTSDEGYIHINSNLNPLKKFTSSSRSTQFKDILP